MVHAQTRTRREILRDFEINRDNLIQARRPDLVIIDKKKRTYHLTDFAVPVDHSVKIKESEKETNISTLPEN